MKIRTAEKFPLSDRGRQFREKITSLRLVDLDLTMIRSVRLRSLLCTLVFLGGGYTFATVNHGFQLPMIRYFAGENLLHNDLLLLIIPAYTTYFYKWIGFLGLNYLQLEILFFVLYVASIYLFVESLIRIFDHIGNRAHISLVAGLAIAAGFMPALGLDPWQHKLDHSIPGLAMAGWALYLFIARRERLAFALLGLLFNLHALYAAHLFIVLGAYQLYRFRFDQLLLNVQLLLLFSIFSAPVVIWKLTSMAADSSMDSAWLTVLHERIGSQLFIGDASYWWIATFSIFVGLVLMAWRSFFSDSVKGDAKDRVRFVLASSLVLTAFQIILTECWPVRIALEGQFWRLTQWFAMLGLAVVILTIDRITEGEERLMRRLLGFSALSLSLLGSLLGLTSSLLGFVLLKVKNDGRFAALGAATLLGVLGVIGVAQWTWWIPDLSRAVSYPGGHFAATAMGAALFVFLLNHVYRRNALCWVLVLFAVGIYLRLQPAKFSILDDSVDPWRQAQSWVREHTERDSIVLTPPDLSGFRIYSDRAVVGEYKDGGMVNNNKEFALSWRQRMHDMGMQTSREFGANRWRVRDRITVSTYEEKSGTELANLAQRYGARIIVTRAEQEVALPELWSNGTFRIYTLPRHRKSSFN